VHRLHRDDVGVQFARCASDSGGDTAGAARIPTRGRGESAGAAATRRAGCAIDAAGRSTSACR